MRSPRDKVIITCAVTGNLTTPEQTPHLPITPEQIADACLGAADAGAAIVHIHVRDPLTGRPSMSLDHYVDVVERIRSHNPELILNITTGPGGRFVPSHDDPKIAAAGTTLMIPEKRVEHIAVLRPDICTLDLNTMNSGKEVVINTPTNVRRMAKVIADAGVKPEIELFDSGDIAFQPVPETVLYARDLLPNEAEFTAIGIGKAAFTSVAQSYLAGGHVRVGIEDSAYLSRGRLAISNAEMVVKARRIVEDLGGTIATFAEARRIAGLPAKAPSIRAA